MKRLAAIAAFAALSAAAAATLAPDTPLITDGPLKVDVLDLNAFLLRVPENMRGEVRTSYDRVASMADSVFITRAAADKAREEGLDKDPVVQRRLQQLQEGFLADLYLHKLQKDVESVNLDKRARELYDADPDRFKSPEMVYLQQVLVSFKGRTREMALERANKALEEAKSGKKDFLEIAAQYTDDPRQNPNGGDLGYFATQSLAAPIQAAAAKLHKKGELAGPIETDNGFSVIRFVDRHEPKIAKFEAVKKKIIEAERERLQKQRVDRFVNETRGSKSVVVNRENVEAYVIPVDVNKLKQAEQQK